MLNTLRISNFAVIEKQRSRRSGLTCSRGERAGKSILVDALGLIWEGGPTRGHSRRADEASVEACVSVEGGLEVHRFWPSGWPNRAAPTWATSGGAPGDPPRRPGKDWVTARGAGRVLARLMRGLVDIAGQHDT